MTTLQETGFAPLEAEGRLVNPVFKGPLSQAGAFGFRGELALKFKANVEKEQRPPELLCQQVLALARAGEETLPFFAGYLLSFADLGPLAEVLSKSLRVGGKYFAFCNNIDLGARYQVELGGATWYVLPIDEATVYNELLDLLHLEKNELKRLDSAGKLAAVARAALAYGATYAPMTYAEGLSRMGKVRDPGENRPV